MRAQRLVSPARYSVPYINLYYIINCHYVQILLVISWRLLHITTTTKLAACKLDGLLYSVLMLVFISNRGFKMCCTSRVQTELFLIVKLTFWPPHSQAIATTTPPTPQQNQFVRSGHVISDTGNLSITFHWKWILVEAVMRLENKLVSETATGMQLSQWRRFLWTEWKTIWFELFPLERNQMWGVKIVLINGPIWVSWNLLEDAAKIFWNLCRCQDKVLAVKSFWQRRRRFGWSRSRYV